MLRGAMTSQEFDHPLATRFKNFVRNPRFCCVGAKSALARGQMTVKVARNISSAWDDLDIYPELLEFTRDYRRQPRLFQSFVVLFQGPRTLSETGFEHALWDRVQSLTDKDVWYGNKPDRRVSEDPENPHFSLSFGGEAFFVVGLHPRASRPARRFEAPAMVFNLHDQFERLRREGAYEKLRGTIIARDIVQSGSINPMLSRHGDLSEARQYSGRAVDAAWACPFQRQAMPGQTMPDHERVD
jgi:FPC/CPF motif-containing protein YcgG